MRICISSGHSTKCQGAVGILNEVEEATAVVDQVASCLAVSGHDVMTYHDMVSTNKNECLKRICDWHNAQGPHDLDISVHFNASDSHEGHGCEVFYYSDKALAAQVSAAISGASTLKDRGAKDGKGLYFLSHTAEKALLLEICFVDHAGDAEKYRTYFPLICEAIASALTGDESEYIPPEPTSEYLFEATGKCSHFGGPQDTGVSEDEGLAFIYEVLDAPHLFLPEGTPGTKGMGLARRLNAKAVHYIACRWDYSVTPKEMLAGDGMALVTNVTTGLCQTAFCADWGPNEMTGRVADLSPALMRNLGLETDDVVEVVYPWKGD